MKKLLIFTIGCLLCISCSDMIEPDALYEKTSSKAEFNLNEDIGESEALEMARRVHDRNGTRSLSLESPSIQYVVNTSDTRSGESSDTTAYVINYPDDGGFVIVATNRHINPILGFSDEGCFTFDNELAQHYFIDNINNYIAENEDPTSTFSIADIDFSGYNHIEPIINIKVDQGSPWDKYVVIENPGCPVGCVAVATAFIMTHCKSSLRYHDTNYNMRALIWAIYDGQNLTPQPPQPPIYGTLADGSIIYPAKYNFVEAKDAYAKILYWIGKDVDMDYSIGSSGAKSINALHLLQKENYIVSSNDFFSFNAKSITSYLKEGNMVYSRGQNLIPNKEGKHEGHAWICDGCYYKSLGSEIKETYIHCNWGWNGRGDGYFYGDVFEAIPNSQEYKIEQWFAVKKEY